MAEAGEVEQLLGDRGEPLRLVLDHAEHLGAPLVGDVELGPT